MTRARALSHRTAKGKHYGVLTAKALDVLRVLLWQFHNARTGLCFPSLATIADAAGCCEATVTSSLKALEAAALLTWCNRLKRVRERVAGLFGGDNAGRVRVVRTSNGYRFNDPQPTKAPPNPVISSNPNFQGGTQHQDTFLITAEPEKPPTALEIALQRFGRAFAGKEGLAMK
jgi:hypothetical protein